MQHFLVFCIYQLSERIIKNKTQKYLYNEYKVKDILVVGAFAGVAYFVSRCYRQKTKTKRCVKHCTFSSSKIYNTDI